MVVDTKVDRDVGEAAVPATRPDDEQRGRLLASPVAARLLRGREAPDEPRSERLAAAGLERLGERAHGHLRDEDVPLRPVRGPRAATSPVEARGAGVRHASAARVHDPDLPVLAAFVGRRRAFDDLLRGQPLAQEREALRPVPRIRIRLGRDRAHSRLRPGDDRADGEELRLHGDSPLAPLEIAGTDRVRGDAARCLTGDWRGVGAVTACGRRTHTSRQA